MHVINLSIHPVTPEQQAAGVVELPERAREQLATCMIDDCPTSSHRRLIGLAAFLADMAVIEGEHDYTGEPATHALIACSTTLRPHLAAALKAVNCLPLEWVDNTLVSIGEAP